MAGQDVRRYEGPKCARDGFCLQELTGVGKTKQTYKNYLQKPLRGGHGGTKRRKTREIS